MSKIEADLMRLRVENDMLKALLTKHGIALPLQVGLAVEIGSVQQSNANTLSPDEKIKLFRRLFHGREDVYPIRWESKTTSKPIMHARTKVAVLSEFYGCARF